MTGLDVSSFAPEVARILLFRGVGLPPLQWKDDPNRGAKRLLDGLDDAALFAMPNLADEQMGVAVRGLLYLWTGWLGECQMFSDAAPEAERLYMSALCERHAGRSAQAKALFQRLQTHPIYEPMATYAAGALASVTDPLVQKVREMLQQDQRWEPYLFCDVLAQAGAARLKASTDTILREFVRREFELLLVHCYEAATGHKISQHSRAPASTTQQNAQLRERRIREERRRKEDERKRQEFAAKLAQAQPTQDPARPASGLPLKAGSTSAGEQIGVLCPKCGHVQQVSAAVRGKPVQCPKCGIGYLVPGGSTPAVVRTAN